MVRPIGFWFVFFRLSTCKPNPSGDCGVGTSVWAGIWQRVDGAVGVCVWGGENEDQTEDTEDIAMDGYVIALRIILLRTRT